MGSVLCQENVMKKLSGTKSCEALIALHFTLIAMRRYPGNFKLEKIIWFTFSKGSNRLLCEAWTKGVKGRNRQLNWEAFTTVQARIKGKVKMLRGYWNWEISGGLANWINWIPDGTGRKWGFINSLCLYGWILQEPWMPLNGMKFCVYIFTRTLGWQHTQVSSKS